MSFYIMFRFQQRKFLLARLLKVWAPSRDMTFTKREYLQSHSSIMDDEGKVLPKTAHFSILQIHFLLFFRYVICTPACQLDKLITNWKSWTCFQHTNVELTWCESNLAN